MPVFEPNSNIPSWVIQEDYYTVIRRWVTREEYEDTSLTPQQDVQNKILKALKDNETN